MQCRYRNLADVKGERCHYETSGMYRLVYGKKFTREAIVMLGKHLKRKRECIPNENQHLEIEKNRFSCGVSVFFLKYCLSLYILPLVSEGFLVHI